MKKTFQKTLLSFVVFATLVNSTAVFAQEIESNQATIVNAFTTNDSDSLIKPLIILKPDIGD